MKTKFLVLVGVSLAAGLLTALQAADQAKPDNREDDALAQNVVIRSARVREGDIVQISGDFKDAPLLEALAVQVRKQGAYPLVTATSDRLARRLFDDVPARFDSQEPRLALKLAEIVNVQLSIDSMDEQALAGVPTERLAAEAKAGEPVTPLLLKRNVRLVSVGNGLYPTASRARQYGMNEADLARIFRDGLNVDYARMQATGEELQKILGNGKELHLTNANGTDLKVRIEKRPVLVSDGNLTPEKIQKGGAAVWTWLPAGEVYVAPVVDSAEGTVVLDRLFFEGKEVTGVTMQFKAGKLTDLQAKTGGERFLERYKVGEPGKDRFGAIDVGINPNVRIPKDSKLLAYMAAGMVSVWTGNNTWAGGDNTASGGVGGFVPGSTLEVDGRVIVKNGALML